MYVNEIRGPRWEDLALTQPSPPRRGNVCGLVSHSELGRPGPHPTLSPEERECMWTRFASRNSRSEFGKPTLTLPSPTRRGNGTNFQ
jgi:hypothetical protein